MSSKLSTPLLVILIAAAVVLAGVLLGGRLLNGDDSLLRNVVIDAPLITPNADGDSDATAMRYELSRNATVSIYFEDAAGDRFYFRQEKPRGAGAYEVLFSGVVDGYRRANDTVEGEILSRLLQDGEYTWVIEATDFDGNVERQEGTLTIAAADTQLPEMRNFTIDKTTFTPNRDGIADRALIQFYLAKDVASSRVYLRLPDGTELPIAEQERDIIANTAGRHYYDYEGGVDNGGTPPPDGAYQVVAEAQDLEGQRLRVTTELEILYGGVPRADIISPPTGNTVQWSASAVALCDTLYFTMTVRNYGNTPIRTTGPAPGTVYDSDWNYNTVGWPTESGAFRVAIGFENELTNYPYRWAVGNVEDLQRIGDYYYLMPGQRAVVTGSIRVVDVFGVRNPQPIWAGLIHEDVEITAFNDRVDTQSILVDVPDADNMPTCAPRAIPVRVLPEGNN